MIFEESVSDVLTDITVEYDDIERIIRKLSSKSGPGPDGVPTLCLKNRGTLVVEAIVDIARESLKQGYIPAILKPVWVTLVWKGTDREEAANYRPISITNHILKVVERVVRQQMADYLTNSGLLSDDQHGA